MSLPETLLALPDDQVDLWQVDMDAVCDGPLLDRYRAILAPEEREKETRFHFARDRLLHLVARTLVRTVLSRYVPIAPRDWCFTTNAYGRPMIANHDALAANISFNISHTEGMVLMAVTRGRRIGIDAEREARIVPLEMAEHFFSASESAALRLLAPAVQQERFFALWTLKESYIKARGMGLSIPLADFSFELDGEMTIRVSFDDGLLDQPRHWQFWQWRPSPDHFAALCVEAAAETRIRLCMHNVMPLVYSDQISYDLLRSSAGQD